MFGVADYWAFVVAVIVFLAIPGVGNLAIITSTSITPDSLRFRQSRLICLTPPVFKLSLIASSSRIRSSRRWR